MKHTNRQELIRGLKFMAAGLPCTFLGPVIVTSSFKNQEHPFFIPILILGIIVMAAAIFLIFKGIRIIMKALFDN